jgi:hypothetical protein
LGALPEIIEDPGINLHWERYRRSSKIRGSTFIGSVAGDHRGSGDQPPLEALPEIIEDPGINLLH